MKNAPFVASYGPVISNGTIGAQPSVFLSNGLPTPVAIDPVNPSGAVIAVDQNFKSTRVQQFNLIVEKEYAGNVLGAGLRGFSRRPRAPERRRGRCGHQPGAGWARGRGRTPCVRDARAGSHEHQHADHAVRNVVQRDAARVPAPLSRRLLDQLELHAGAQRVDGVGAVECRGHRALRRRQRRAPPDRVPRQLRAAVGTIDDWRREALRGGMAGECRRRVADRRPVQHHQRCGAREHRRRRPAESRRQSRARESGDHPLLRHDGVPGAAGQHHWRSDRAAQPAPRSVAEAARHVGVQRRAAAAAPRGCSCAWRSTT